MCQSTVSLHPVVARSIVLAGVCLTALCKLSCVFADLLAAGCLLGPVCAWSRSTAVLVICARTAARSDEALPS